MIGAHPAALQKERRSAPLAVVRDGVPLWLPIGALGHEVLCYERNEQLEAIWRAGQPNRPLEQASLFDVLARPD